MDIFGVTVMAFVTACGGGVLRDVVMNRGIPVFFSDYRAIAVVGLSVATVAAAPQIFREQKILTLLDAAGLAFFAVDAGVKAIALQYNFVQFMFAAVITGVGGGVLRDLLAQRMPMIFRQQDIYAVAVIIGCIFMWFAAPVFGIAAAAYTAIPIIFIVRMLSVYFHIGLPQIALDENKRSD